MTMNTKQTIVYNDELCCKWTSDNMTFQEVKLKQLPLLMTIFHQMSFFHFCIEFHSYVIC